MIHRGKKWQKSNNHKHIQYSKLHTSLTQKILSYPSLQIGQFKDAITFDNSLSSNLELQTSIIFYAKYDFSNAEVIFAQFGSLLSVHNLLHELLINLNGTVTLENSNLINCFV